MGRTKFTPSDIATAFTSAAPKQKVFGNFRIEENVLFYRGQASIEHYADKNSRAELGTLLSQYDGRLTKDGRTVLLETLPDADLCGTFKIEYHTLYPIVVRTQQGYVFNACETNTAYYDTQRLIGEVRSIIRGRHFGHSLRMRCLTNPGSIRIIDALNDLMLFQCDGRTIIQNEVQTVALPEPASSIAEAHEMLCPFPEFNRAGQLNTGGYNVYTRPCAAPDIQPLTDAEKIKLLSAYSYYGAISEVCPQQPSRDDVEHLNARVPQDRRASELFIDNPEQAKHCGYLTLPNCVVLNGTVYACMQNDTWHEVLPGKGVCLETIR